MERWVGVFGLVVFLAIAYLFSTHRRRISPRIVVLGIFLQFVLALLILGVPALGITGPFRPFFDWINTTILSLLQFTNEGSRFLFGDLVSQEKSGPIIAIQVLPTIIFFTALMTIMYHLRIMQVITYAIGVVMHRLMGTSGAESLSAAANIFVGQTEAPIVVKPYIEKLTHSELFAVMVGGMATVAGGVFIIYVNLLRDIVPDIAGHLLAASVMSAPASLVMAKIMIPEVNQPTTAGVTPLDLSRGPDHNMIEAAARGASEGLKLAVNVGAMLLAFIALIALLDHVLGVVGSVIGFSYWGHHFVSELAIVGGQVPPLSFSLVLGWLFAPLAWLMGVPWEEIAIAGSLLGQKIVLNEFIAYLELMKVSSQLSPRTLLIMSYALCGFANFTSIAIQIGGIGGLAPSKKSELAQLGIRSIVGGSLAAFMTACFAGILY